MGWSEPFALRELFDWNSAETALEEDTIRFREAIQ
jgi:hypothetical protein